MTIKPIPRYFDGHLYRSTLETRYAVLFKVFGIDYDPEPETFLVQMDGFSIRYQPDFVLRNLNCTEQCFQPIYVEVKGVDAYSEIYENDRRKIESFSKDHSILVVGNMPFRSKDMFLKPDELFSFRFISGSSVSCFFNVFDGVPWLADAYRVMQNSAALDNALYLANKAVFDDIPEDYDARRYSAA